MEAQSEQQPDFRPRTPQGLEQPQEHAAAHEMFEQDGQNNKERNKGHTDEPKQRVVGKAWSCWCAKCSVSTTGGNW